MTKQIQKIVEEGYDEKLQEDWRKYFIDKNSEMETEYANLVNGVRMTKTAGFTKAGYDILRRFYDGDQWLHTPEGGQVPRVYNMLRGVVNNFTAFMVNEPLDVDVPPEDITDDIEVARAEEKERLLRDILEDNEFENEFEAAVQNGSLLGDSIMLGPFYDEDEDRISLYNVKEPEHIRIIWSDTNFNTIYGFIHHYFVSLEKAYEMYPEAREKGIVFNTVETGSGTTVGSAAKTGRGAGTSGAHQRQMVELMDCWTSDVHMLIVGNKVLEFEDNEPGFVPIRFVRNIIHPRNSTGTSDIEDLLDAQCEINERNADMSEVISETAYSWIFGKNLDPAEVQSGKLNMIDVGDEAEIITDPRRGQPQFLDNEVQRRMSTFFQISGMNENIFGGSTVRAVTGRALSVLMNTVNNRIKGRQTRWSVALKGMFADIFRLVELYVPGGKELVNGYYKSDIFFPATLLRNITDELNKFNAKLQSQETTMKNLGVPSPKDERKLMKQELQDEILMVELSRNPGLQLQIHQMLQQKLAEKVAGNKPMLREDENMEEQPSAEGGAPQQSAVGAEGAINQAVQRAGANAPKEAKEE